MIDKEISILKEQIQKLDLRGFDLESWKINSINILERIFGSSSVKIEQIKELKYDFSSWNLRDTSGSAGSIRKKARVIIESAINELEMFGLPSQVENKEEFKQPVIEVLEDELKGVQFKKLKEILKSENIEEKNKAIALLLNELDIEVKENILLNILSKIKI